MSPQTWIAIAAGLVLIALVLFVVAWRSRRAAGRSDGAEPGAPAVSDGDLALDDDARTGPVMDRPAGDGHVARRYLPVGEADPARTGDRAKDRLLAVLLGDPDGAVDVVAALPDHAPASGAAAASLLRAGLTPTQVARLCRLDESDLADVVARDLGLIEAPAPRGQGRSVPLRTGTNRSEEPGRAWASAGSARGSTTPTTG